MKLINNEIYNYAQLLATAFQDSEQKLPIKLNFFIQKNKTVLINLAQDIEKARMEIVQNYGILDAETNQYVIEPNNIQKVNDELSDLLNLEQEVNICMVNLNNLNDDLILTTAQMEAIMFMLEEA